MRTDGRVPLRIHHVTDHSLATISYAYEFVVQHTEYARSTAIRVKRPPYGSWGRQV